MTMLRASHHSCPKRKGKERKRQKWRISENNEIIMEFLLKRGKR
jgi:hypothetical protein